VDVRLTAEQQQLRDVAAKLADDLGLASVQALEDDGRIALLDKQIEVTGWRSLRHKIWTSYSDVADWCLLLARTDPDANRHRGLSPRRSWNCPSKLSRAPNASSTCISSVRSWPRWTSL
jgi:alkylation response protein AidB-like acyl-CoA dehydrogenase